MTAAALPRGQRAPRWVTIFAIAALVWGPFLDYLWYNHYPLLTPEVLVPTALWLACAIGIGSLLNRAPRAVRIVVFAALLLAFVDCQLTYNTHYSLKVVALVLLAAVWLLERHLDKILAVSLGAFYLASIPTSSPVRARSLDLATAPHDTALPPVLYLILDQHIGMEGWPPEMASTRAARDQVQRFYLDRGFRLFGRAYSEFTHTASSIPATLNWPSEDPRADVVQIVPGQHYRLRVDGLFARLSGEGYRIRVYQSTYLDFCDPRAYHIRSCEVRPANSVRNISLLDLPPWSKAELVASFFLEHYSDIYLHLRALLAKRHGDASWEPPNGWYTFPAAMELMDRLRADLRTDDPRGTLYFAHLLAPHDGYVVDSTCHAWPVPEVQLGRAPDRGTRAPAERARRYDLYAAQVGCLYRHLDALFRVVDSLPTSREMVIIVHGDHGSWITLHDPSPRNLPAMLPSDYTDALSALFAIRAPGIPPGYDRRLVSINELVGRAMESGFRRIEIPERERHVMKMHTGEGLPFVTLRLADTALVPWDSAQSPAGAAPGRSSARVSLPPARP